MWRERKLYVRLMILYAVTSGLLVGIASQSIYTELSEGLRGSGSEVIQGKFSELGRVGTLLGSALTGGLAEPATETQVIYGVILILLAWLTTVWLTRAVQSGKRPRLRDALYNSGAPVIPTAIIGGLLALQLMPLALGLIAVSAVSVGGLAAGGVEAMLVAGVAALLAIVSLYWLASTFIALVIVTLPGMYPYQAIRAAGDIVIGRRLRVLLRFIWLIVVMGVMWLVVMLPIILLDALLKGVMPFLKPWPLVPFALLLMSSVTVVFAAVYVYLFYRKVIDNDAVSA